MASIREWAKHEKLSEASDEVNTPSHLLHDGGKIYVPRSREYEFLEKYAAELDKKSKLFFIETRPHTFKLMVDLDISDDHYWEQEEVIKLVQFIQKYVYDFFCRDVPVICCMSSKKVKNDKIHTGIHLIWPGIVVISENALIIREGILQQLNENYKCPEDKTWEDIIDKRVYISNGYRMVGSDKMTIIDGNKIPEGRPLELKFVVGSDGEIRDGYYNRLKNSTKDLVKETSIRYVPDIYLEKGMEIKIPEWLERTEQTTSTTQLAVTNKVEIIKILEQFIVTNMNAFKNKKKIVKDIEVYPDHNILVKTNSKFCMNLGREHNSCGIYFLATPNGMYQKCLCPCETKKDRINGLCRDYTSKCYEFNEKIRTQLFPEPTFEPNNSKNSKNNSKNKTKKSTTKKTTYSKHPELDNFKTEKETCDKLLNAILS